MKEIPLTKGYIALVDDSDYERVIAAGPWHAQVSKNTVYAAHGTYTGHGCNGRRGLVLLHRFILGLSDPQTQGDHADGNGLNNQRYNLRPATNSQNTANRLKKPGGSSVYKGVTWDKRDWRWRAAIRINGKTKHLGSFTDEADAAAAYRAAAKEHFGVFTRFKKTARAPRVVKAERKLR